MLCVGDIFPTSPFPTTSGITKPLPVKEGYVNVVYMFPLKLSAKMEPEQEQILDNQAFRPFPLINLIILSNGGISTRQNNHRTFDETEIYFCSKEHHQNIFNCGVDSAGNPIRTIFILGDRGQIKKIFTSAISCRCYFYDQKCCLAGSCSMNCLIAENIQETVTPLFHQSNGGQKNR
uniref:CX domain-containing protein n=1 Tax=Panagrolaimus davidi TaxID=227884 RepID=A0A914PIY7_9BILA